MKNWSASNIPDLTGKVIIITGANAGLGFEASKELSRKGATVIMACRNMEKATVAVNQLKKEIPLATVEFMQLDLASLRSVRSFGPYTKTEDGFESTIGTNVLGHFALTGLLMEVIKQTPNSRVVNVSSLAHESGKINFDDLMSEIKYEPGKVYAQTKLANILFTNELQRRFENAGIDCKAVSLNPGLVKTGWLRHMRQSQKIRPFLIGIGLQLFGQSVEMGALALLRAAVDPAVKGAEYFSTSGRFGGYPVVAKSNQASFNQADARKLWEVAEKLTGVVFSFREQLQTTAQNA